MLPELARGLHQQLHAVEAPSGGCVVKRKGSIVTALKSGHLCLPQQPAQDVKAAVSAAKQEVSYCSRKLLLLLSQAQNKAAVTL
jgi:hypothetical protein